MGWKRHSRASTGSRFPTLPRTANEDIRTRFETVKKLYTKMRRSKNTQKADSLRSEAHDIIASHLLREHSELQAVSERFPRVYREHPHHQTINAMYKSHRQKKQRRYVVKLSDTRQRLGEECNELLMEARRLARDVLGEHTAAAVATG
eukprot:4929533-Karenia_brevis.AAC.1